MASGERGLYGSRTGGPVLKAAAAELVGTAILVFAGTAVAVSAILGRPTAGEAEAPDGPGAPAPADDTDRLGGRSPGARAAT